VGYKLGILVGLMQDYRLYYLEDENHIVQSAEFRCDADAMSFADEQRDHRAMELCA
jgi:hypothetical protein